MKMGLNFKKKRETGKKGRKKKEKTKQRDNKGCKDFIDPMASSSEINENGRKVKTGELGKGIEVGEQKNRESSEGEDCWGLGKKLGLSSKMAELMQDEGTNKGRLGVEGGRIK